MGLGQEKNVDDIWCLIRLVYLIFGVFKLLLHRFTNECPIAQRHRLWRQSFPGRL